MMSNRREEYGEKGIMLYLHTCFYCCSDGGLVDLK